MQTIADLTAHLNTRQISEEVEALLHKLMQGEAFADLEHATLVNPTEAAALLSVKYRRQVSHRYIKELTRSVTNRKTGHVTPARLKEAKRAGTAFLYRAGDVLAVELRESSQEDLGEKAA